MGSKCPPGVICIENMTLTLAIIVLAVIGYVAYYKSDKTIHLDVSNFKFPSQSLFNSQSTVHHEHSTHPSLAPTPTRTVGMPINIPTQGGHSDSVHSQVGILKGGGEILPLMGKQLITSRDTWNFYAVSNQRNQVRLPISFKGKSCTSEYGCDNLSTGDNVYVEGYDQVFDVTMYDKQPLRYIPL